MTIVGYTTYKDGKRVGEFPAYVRCKDATLVRDLLTVGAVYECSGEQDHNYFVKGKWLSRGRFESATFEEWVAGINA